MICKFNILEFIATFSLHLFFPLGDSAMNWLTEAVLLGCGDARLADLHLSEESATLLDLALGSSREPASGLWRKMKEYAVSRGEDRLIGEIRIIFIFNLF